MVVGGGVFGLTAALELRARGWTVTLVDPGPLPHPDAATTDISKMVRMDYGADAFYARLGRAALDGWQRWNRDWSFAPYHQTGFLILAGQPMAPGGYEYESVRVLEQLGVPYEHVHARDLEKRFPAWVPSGRAGRRPRYPEGYVSLHAGWAESGRVSGELARRAAESGVRIVTGSSFSEVVEHRGATAGVRLEDGTRIEADHVVIAAGSWTPFLLPELQEVMWPTAQSVFHLQVSNPEEWRPPRFLPFSADISESGWYGFPALEDGRLKIAHHGKGRRLSRGEPRVVPEGDVSHLRSFLADALPELAEAPVVHTRVCVYCDTFDGDFWIAPHPSLKGLTIASGGSGHGFKFAPVLGGITADVVEGRDNPWAERFRWRELGAISREWARSVS